MGVIHPARMTAQSWPVHSMDRPRPPVVDPGPERPPVPPPSDAIVLFDGKDLSQWRAQAGPLAQGVGRDGYPGAPPGTGSLHTAPGLRGGPLHTPGGDAPPPTRE